MLDEYIPPLLSDITAGVESAAVEKLVRVFGEQKPWMNKLFWRPQMQPAGVVRAARSAQPQLTTEEPPEQLKGTNGGR